MKKALWAASLLLVAGTATACGGDDAPSDASKEDFCATAIDMNGLETPKDVKDYAEKLEDVGTPEDMSDGERKGFDLFIETANKLDDDTTEEDASKLVEDLSEDEQKDFEAFTTYLTKTCAEELLGDLPTDELPTDELPTDGLPTDELPTEGLPSDLASELSDLATPTIPELPEPS